LLNSKTTSFLSLEDDDILIYKGKGKTNDNLRIFLRAANAIVALPVKSNWRGLRLLS
jgi:hypothetical protein